MNNNLLILKVRERLNKISSSDFDNIEKWQIAEAVNKAQIEIVRSIIGGRTPTKEGDEQSKLTVDDIQVLLTESKPTIRRYGNDYYEFPLPADYFGFKRVSISATSDCCPERPMTVYQAEEANVDNLLSDENSCPSFEWAETFLTLINNKVRIYVDETFRISKCKQIYYREPRKVIFDGTVDPETGLVGRNQTSELKRDVVEIIVDEAAKILAGDLENTFQYQRQDKEVNSKL